MQQLRYETSRGEKKLFIMANTDLRIRVKSKLGTTQQVLLYQEAVL